MKVLIFAVTLTVFVAKARSADFVPMEDAKQSSTETKSGCTGNICTADKVIDGNTGTEFGTMGVTLANAVSWWSARMTVAAKIDHILVYAQEWPFKNGYYKRFKVETKMKEDDPWTLCKGEYAMTRPIAPHVVVCNQPTTAQFVRISVAGSKALYLREVQVVKVPATTGMCTATHPFSYLNGKYCCKYDTEKTHAASGKSCDGSKIGFTSTCCKDDAHANCPGGKICAPYTTGMCPVTHPFAYLNGKYCCKTGYEKTHAPSGESCDGGKIGFTSTCCKDNAHAGCPDGKICKNYKEVEWTEQVGYCRDCDGKDQNNGAVAGSSTGKADCLAKCRRNPRALACEIHVPSNWCTAYTAKVSQGYPLDKKHICWAPPKNVECLKPELRWANPPTPAPATTLSPARPLSAYLGCWNWISNAPGQTWGWPNLRFKKDNAVQVMTRVGKGDNWKASDDTTGVFPASEGWYVLGVNQPKYYMRIMEDGKIHWRKFQIQHSFCKPKAFKGKKGYCNDYGTAESYPCPTTAPPVATTMVPKPTGCIDIDTNYQDHDIPGGQIKGVETWQECAKNCANSPDCVRFTYATSTFSNAKVRQNCFLKKDGDLVKQADRKGLISGPALAKECKADYSFAKNQDNTECSNYSAQDCYREKASFKRHDKKLLIYWRYDITWENIRGFTKSLVCTCAKAAKAAGKKYFAIHFWGECWAMNMDDFRKVNGGDCRRDYDKKCNGNDKRMCFADKDFQVYKTA